MRLGDRSVCKAGFMTMCESGDSQKCPLSVLSGLILEKIYELFVGTNETVRNIRVSVLSGCLPKKHIFRAHVAQLRDQRKGLGPRGF